MSENYTEMALNIEYLNTHTYIYYTLYVRYIRRINGVKIILNLLTIVIAEGKKGHFKQQGEQRFWLKDSLTPDTLLISYSKMSFLFLFRPILYSAIFC